MVMKVKIALKLKLPASQMASQGSTTLQLQTQNLLPSQRSQSSKALPQVGETSGLSHLLAERHQISKTNQSCWVSYSRDQLHLQLGSTTISKQMTLIGWVLCGALPSSQRCQGIPLKAWRSYLDISFYTLDNDFLIQIQDLSGHPTGPRGGALVRLWAAAGP